MSYQKFDGLSSIAKPLLTEQLQVNMIEFLDWNFVDAGGYINVSLSNSGEYGGDKSRLRPVDDPRYTDGQVWEGYRNNWVWQSGVGSTPSPIQVSGVYIDGTFYAPTDTTYSHHVNYPLGRIVFDSAIDTTSVVQAEYSPKFVKVVDAERVPLFRRIQFNSWRVDDSTFLQSSSGNWALLGDQRVQLPVVAIDVCSNRTFYPYQIGGGQVAETDIVFHVLGEDKWSTSQLVDALSYQNDKNIYLFDTNMMKDDNQPILNINGSITTGTKTYPQLVAESGDGGYRYKKCFLNNARVQDGQWINDRLYKQTVRLNTEVILGDI